MLFKITVLTSLIFSTLYPLCFWISYKDPLKNKFHKFHLGLPNVIAGITVVVLLFSPIPLELKALAVLWKILLLSTSRLEWKKPYPRPAIISIPCIFGLYTFMRIQEYLFQPGLNNIFVWILGGLILCSSLFAMNLGHWYLNVHGLPMKHLKSATYVFWILLCIRAVYDTFIIFTSKVLYAGDYIPMSVFLFKTDGIFIILALLFGTLFPLCALFFVKETLRLKNTQSSTGILYVILCSVILGDITYKYYLLKFGIAL